MPTQPVSTWEPAGRLDPIYRPELAPEQNVQLAQGTYPKGQVLGELLGTNDVSTLHASAALTGGTFTITVNGKTTAAIAYNATAAQVQAALDAALGGGNVTAAGGPLSTPTDISLTFKGAYGYQPQTVTVTPTGITGGTLSVVHTTPGTNGTKGTFTKYVYSNTDGSQLAKGILQYACTVDAQGNITLTGEWGQTTKAAPVYMGGFFQTSELVGLDDNAVAQLGGAIVEGTLASGILWF